MRSREFYTYIYNDEAMLPYYVGKGSRSRHRANHGLVPVPPASRILRQYWVSEDEAHVMEIWWIGLLGRKDLGTGNLLNRDQGGRTPSRATCIKAGTTGGRKHVESGHILRIATRESCIRGGRASGPINGKISGAITARNRRWFITSMATSDSCAMGGRIGGARHVGSGHLARISARGNHFRWHVKRNVVRDDCAMCMMEKSETPRPKDVL